MSIFSRRKNRMELLEDDWGDKGAPLKSDKQSLDDIGVYPVLGKPQKTKNMERLLTRGISIIALLLLGLFFIAPFRQAANINEINALAENAQSPAFKTQYEDLGKSIIQAYYSEDNPPVNLMADVEWSAPIGPNETEAPGGGSSRDVTKRVSVENLALIEAPRVAEMAPSQQRGTVFVNPRKEVLIYSGEIDGETYRFSVNLVIPDVEDPTTLPYLSSAPVMMPSSSVIMAQEQNIDSPPTGSGSPYTALELNDVSLRVITNWASAYAQGDSDELKRITGDKNPYNTYEGVGGFVLEGNPVPVWSFENTGGTTDDQSDDFIVARVKFTMTRPINRDTSSAQDEIFGQDEVTFQQDQTFDVLLANYDSGTANLVSWGPAGSWATIQPFSNAVTMTEDDLEDQADSTGESAAPTSSRATTTSSSAAPTISSQTKTTQSSTTSSRNNVITPDIEGDDKSSSKEPSESPSNTQREDN